MALIHRYVTVALAFISFILLSTFPGWHDEVDDETGSMREVKPFPNTEVSHLCLLFTVASFGFGFVSVLWQHINSSATATMTEILTYGAVSGHVGGAAMALGWISITLIASASIGLFVMILSISLLRRLTTND